MGFGKSFDVNRVTNLENRATADEAAMITNNNQGRQAIPYINASGTTNAMVSIQPLANAVWWGIMEDTNTYSFSMGRFNNPNAPIELRSYKDKMTIRTARSAGAAGANFQIITNDGGTAGISSDIIFTPYSGYSVITQGTTKFYPLNDGVNGLYIDCNATNKNGRIRSLNTAASDLMLSFGHDNTLDVRNNADSAWMPMLASAFNVQSARKYKEDIREFDEPVLEKINAAKIKKYKLKYEQKETFGLILDEAPEEIRGKETLGLYEMVSLLWKAVQELSEKVERLEQ